MRSWSAVAVLLVAVGVIEAQAPGKGADPKMWADVTAKAAQFLKSTQEDNGGWGTKKTPGITGVALTGLLRSEVITPKDPVAEKALKYIESLVNPEDGHIAGKGAKVQLQNYVTSINVMALQQAKQADKYRGIVGDAVTFLKKLQWDEAEGKSPKDDFFGGAGYDSKSRPDLSNTQIFLDAMKAAGVPSNDPAVQRALVFVSRCQNLKSENNDRPWAGKINDGSFIYTPAHGGVTKVVDEPLAGGEVPGYGSMTYAGIKSLVYCGVSKDDPRVQKAYEWIKKNYTMEKNPGMPEARSQWGLYYYYLTLAKSLNAMDVDILVDAKGGQHDWRKDLTEALASRQRPDGSWVGDAHWMESDPQLDTAYALMALSYTRPK